MIIITGNPAYVQRMTHSLAGIRTSTAAWALLTWALHQKNPAHCQPDQLVDAALRLVLEPNTTVYGVESNWARVFAPCGIVTFKPGVMPEEIRVEIY